MVPCNRKLFRGYSGPTPDLVVRLAVEDAQDSEEQVDNVKIKADSGGNLLLDMVVTQHELRINKDVSAEDESSKTTVYELTGRTIREEHRHEAEQDEAPQRTEQVWHPRGEVILGLASEEGQEDEDACGEDHRVQNNGCLVEGDNNGDGVCLCKSEERQEEKVGRVRFAFPVSQAHEDQGTNELDTHNAISFSILV